MAYGGGRIETYDARGMLEIRTTLHLAPGPAGGRGYARGHATPSIRRLARLWEWAARIRRRDG